MTRFRTLWIVLLAVVVSTQGVVATLAMSICCCVPAPTSEVDTPSTPLCPKCAQGPKRAQDETRQASQADRCCLKHVCECSTERIAESVVTRRIADDNSLELRQSRVVDFVPNIDVQPIAQHQPLLLVQAIHLKNCVWLI